MRNLILAGIFAVGSVASAFSVVVELRNLSHRDENTRHYAKLTIPDVSQDEMYLAHCDKEGNVFPKEKMGPVELKAPFMKGDVAKKIYRLYHEPDLAWAIPGVRARMGFAGRRDEDDDFGRRDKPVELRRAWFKKNTYAPGEPDLIFDFYFNDWQLQSISPRAFIERSGFEADITQKTSIGNLLKFTSREAYVGSTDFNLLNNSIRPFEEASGSAAIQQDSRLFVAAITVRGKKDHVSLTFEIPLREVLPPKDGKVHVAVESELRKLFGELMRSGNIEAPRPDLSQIPVEHHAQALEMYVASGLAPKVDPIPKGKIIIHTFNEMDLSIVDAKAYERAVNNFAMVALMTQSGRWRTYGEGHEFNFGSVFGAMDGGEDLESLDLRSYVASHFLSQGGQIRQFEFTDFIRLGMIHSDRMMDCAHQLEKAGMIQLMNQP